MKERWLYYCEWWELTMRDGSGGGNTIRHEFALDTDRPDKALMLIIDSDVNRNMPGPFKSFHGPRGIVFTN
jgi:hypothetical protein